MYVYIQMFIYCMYTEVTANLGLLEERELLYVI